MATNQKIRRLPGFRFETVAAAREDILPRMDIALFIGFAASGPVGIPVPIESEARFGTIFGGDFPLVLDGEKGAMVYACLAPAVRLFFRNGGKRCWVIRTAQMPPNPEKPLNRAAYNYFPLCGVACVESGGTGLTAGPAFVRARSRGSWSDDLSVGTATLVGAVKPVGQIRESEAKIIIRVETSANEPIKTGELLRLEFNERNLSLILRSDLIEPDNSAGQPIGVSRFEVSSERFVWLRNALAEDQLEDQTVTVNLWTGQDDSGSDDTVATSIRTHTARLNLPAAENGLDFQKKPARLELEFSDLSPDDSPAAGSILVAEIQTISPNILSDFHAETLFLQVESVSSELSGAVETVRAICRGVFCGQPFEQPDSASGAGRLSFEIWVKEGETSLTRLSGLEFNPGSNRFWGDLPTDEELHGFRENRVAPAIPGWTQTTGFSDSPVAGAASNEALYFPVFAAAFPEQYIGALELPGTKLERNGLAIFDERLFLDEKLKNTGLNNLLKDAEFIRYQSPRPRTLSGIHAALVPETVTRVASESLPTDPVYASFSLDEATIISIPDLVHRGWSFHENNGGILSPPPPFDPPERVEWWRFQDCRSRKIKAVREPLWGNFLACDTRVIAPPSDLRVGGQAISTGSFALLWDLDEVELSPFEFVLQESTTAEFQAPQEIYRGNKLNFDIANHGAGIFYYRVRVEFGSDVSDWSEGLAVRVPPAENWIATPVANFHSGVLIGVQRALLRMCAARGDLFAVLDLPRHFEKDDAVSHVAALKTNKGFAAATAGGIEPFSAGENAALSYGAVYHPWLLVRGDDLKTVNSNPPSGAVCGVFAQRSNIRGAWIAPANQPMQDILGLDGRFGRENFLELQDAFINLVRHEPNGFLVLNSDTLSDESDLRPINVRRLLSLLRRLALRHGAEYVFEPNNERFRRQVQRGFRSLLDTMFVRGAFAGQTPAASYQVNVSDTVNNFQSLEQGRFIVELRVAPSLPLKFVTVRLINAGGLSRITETV